MDGIHASMIVNDMEILYKKHIDEMTGKFEKTSKITISSYHDPELIEVVHELFHDKFKQESPVMSDDELNEKLHEETTKIFEYGEFMNCEIIVNQSLDIVGGKIIKSGK